jgi:NitT/TauT family transport system substrate-binding protein
MRRRRSLLMGFVLAAALCIAGGAPALAPDKVSIVVFGPPSLGAFLQPVIKQFKLDEANGLTIDFAERTPDAYTAQFNSGEFQVGGSAAVLTVGLADARGVKVAYLFNLFDYWGAVVTSQVGDRIVVLRRPARIAYDVRVSDADGPATIRQRIQEILAE